MQSVTRLTFLAAAAGVVAARLVTPSLMAYGARSGATTKGVASWRVPHSWFAFFYVVSLASSVFWAGQILSRGTAFRLLAGERVEGGVAGAQGLESSMTLHQVIVAWTMMTVQGMRRLYECLAISKPSKSTMWVGHWIMGVSFYLGINVAIWIEGRGTLLTDSFQVSHFLLDAPSLRTFVGVILFILASGAQHDCHAYLASLKRYAVPAHPAFSRVLCPHYFCECLIYLSLAIVAAPPHRLLNGTVTCALVFVVVNLGVTADGTRKWYAQKFGSDGIAGRARMIPFIF